MPEAANQRRHVRLSTMFRSPLLSDLPGIQHAFFSRRRGVSKGLYSSLNCGFASGDDKHDVAENRARAMADLGLPPEALVTASQVHSAAVRVVDRPWGQGRSPAVDGLVTVSPGVALGILSADCAPVLLADADARVAGAAHAGWRGALGGVLEATLEAMVALGARRPSVRAAVGPCIDRRSYEVGPEFPGPFLAAEAGDADLFAPAERRGHFLFDLAGYVRRRLERMGIGEVSRIEADTYGDADRFFSYRRATRLGDSGYGRHLSAICLAP